MGKKVTVLIWNIGKMWNICKYGVPRLSRFSLWRKLFQVSRRSVEKVRSRLREFNADLVLLQEVAGGKHLEALAQGSDYHGFLGPSYGCEDYEEHTAVFSREKPKEVGYLAESTGMEVEVSDLRVLNVHLDLRRKQREEQLKHVLAHTPGERSILGGDFNDDAVKYPLGQLTSCTAHLGPTTIYGWRLDDLLHTPDLTPQSSAVIRTSLLSEGMDHYPIVVTLDRKV